MSTITLLSWNVNGIRAAHKKGFLDWLIHSTGSGLALSAGSGHALSVPKGQVQAQPDILCLQETRAEVHQLVSELAQPAGYQTFWNSSRRKRGYSGTALFSRKTPLSVQFGLGIEEFDQEGRTIIAEYSDFTLLNCYFPNGGRDHKRVSFKLAFYDAFLEKCEKLRSQGRHVIFCGDVNTAHKGIDLANPKANQNTTGFLLVERAWLDRVVEAGYIDTFRHFQPNLPGQYTWWSVPTRSRARNIGWRLDYFFVSPSLADKMSAAYILPDVMGSDHCPVGLQLVV